MILPAVWREPAVCRDPDPLRPTRLAGMLGAIFLLSACLPQRVDIVERPPSGYLAIVHAQPDQGCDAQSRKRGADEAIYFCEARGLKARIVSTSEDNKKQGCVIEIAFWCSAASEQSSPGQASYETWRIATLDAPISEIWSRKGSDVVPKFRVGAGTRTPERTLYNER